MMMTICEKIGVWLQGSGSPGSICVSSIILDRYTPGISEPPPGSCWVGLQSNTTTCTGMESRLDRIVFCALLEWNTTV